MSLQVWLPFTQDLRNLGLNSISVTNHNTTIVDGGKLGKACSFNGSSTYLEFSSAISLSNNFSICCWLDLTNVNSTLYFVGFADNGGIRYGTDNTFLYFNNGQTLTYSFTKVNRFVHVAFTCASNSVKLYVDGTLIGSALTLSSALKNCTIIGKRSDGYYYNGKINDFRIYDHCLTASEVKEISKGLVCHYTLGSVNAEAPALRSRLSSATWNLLINPTRFGSTSSNGVTLSVNQSAGTVTLSGTASAYTVLNFGLATNATTSGHKYLLAGCPKGGYNADTIASNGGTYDLRLNYNGTYYSEVGSGIIFDGGQNANIYCRVANGYNCLNVVFHPMLFDLTAIFGSGNEPTAANFKKAFPMTYYQYDSGTTKDLRLPIPDSSGYSRNLTITGNVSSADSVRYDKCIWNSATSGTYLTMPMLPLQLFTYSFWVKRNRDGLSNREMVMTGWYGLSFEINPSNSLTLRHYLNSTETWDVITTTKLTKNNWYHIAFTRDASGVSKIYVNGALDKSGTNTNSINYQSSTSTWMNYSNSYLLQGGLSDVRVYATALSADDVSDLYKLGALIS